MDQRQLVLVSIDNETLERIGGLIRNVTSIAAIEDDALAAPEVCEGTPPPIAVLGLRDANKGAVFQVIPELSRRGVPVILIGPSKDADLILRAMRAGASEFVVSGDDDDLLRAVTRLASPTAEAGEGRLTAVFPAKGGVGATAIAANLAGALRAAGARTCLVDLDLQFGDVLSFLDLSGGYAISDLIANMRRLDAELLDSSITRHASGVSVLAQSHRIEDAEAIPIDAIEAMLRFLRQHFGAVILDGIRGFSDLALSALDLADQVLLVVTQDVPAVRNARRCLELFQQLGYGEGKVRVVLNRYNKRSNIGIAAVEDTLGFAVAATVANDFPSVISAINQGVMLSAIAPRSRLTRDIEAMTQLVQGETAGPRKKRGLGGLFASRVAADGA